MTAVRCPRLSASGALWLAATFLACNRSDPPEATATPASSSVQLAFASVDCLRSPCGSRPLVAGESARVELGVSEGAPPYTIELSLIDSMDKRVERFPEVQASPDQGGSSVTVASGVRIPRTVRSGSYRLRAAARDSSSARVTAMSKPFEVVGDGAPLTQDHGSPAALIVVDAGGRRRASFHRGERLQIQVKAGAIAGSAQLMISAPSGAVLAESTLAATADGGLSLAFDIPRLALAGDYHLKVTGRDVELSSTLAVEGEPFAPLAKLGIDSLDIFGGTDSRSARGAILSRGETLLIEARVGGYEQSVAATLRLRDSSGALADESKLGERRASQQHPTARIFVGGSWTVPEQLSAGNYTLEVEASEGDRVSTRHRRIVLR